MKKNEILSKCAPGGLGSRRAGSRHSGVGCHIYFPRASSGEIIRFEAPSKSYYFSGVSACSGQPAGRQPAGRAAAGSWADGKGGGAKSSSFSVHSREEYGVARRLLRALVARRLLRAAYCPPRVTWPAARHVLPPRPCDLHLWKSIGHRVPGWPGRPPAVPSALGVPAGSCPRRATTVCRKGPLARQRGTSDSDLEDSLGRPRA